MIFSPVLSPRAIPAVGNQPATVPTLKIPAIPAWTLTFMSAGKRRVERIPKEWVEVVAQRVRAGREFQDAVREVLTANAELIVLARKQKRKLL
jgi:hypothetical protein